MKALFFGDSSRQLMGVYHEPQSRTGVPRDTGVVLCYPGAPEYNMSHWAFRKLAGMLSREGFHVLRFDYRGTGDSAGRLEDASSAIWVEDIRAAAAELRDMSGARAISLVGMRLGAALAARACAEGLSVRDLVLWQPIISGGDYLVELDRMDQRRNLLLLHPRPFGGGPPRELFGFAITPEQRRDLEQLDLRRLGKLNARRVLIMVQESQPDLEPLRSALAATGIDTQLSTVTGDVGGTEREAAMLSNKILVAMTEALSRKAAA